MSKKLDKPKSRGKIAVRPPANEKQRAWQGGYGHTVSLMRLKSFERKKQKELAMARELERDVIEGLY